MARNAPPNVSTAELERMFDVAPAQKLRELQRKLEQVDATHPGAPPRGMVLADKPTPHNVHVLSAGNADNQGPESSAAVPGSGPLARSGSHSRRVRGRLELGRAIASANNPLTARVIVNRVWLQHFGAGLVKTPSDLGCAPSHRVILSCWITSPRDLSAMAGLSKSCIGW
jgi:hypothetical protein